MNCVLEFCLLCRLFSEDGDSSSAVDEGKSLVLLPLVDLRLSKFGKETPSGC